ncbi:hypothetical protein PybrP1_009996 [[Pythium] brassicae (nom. inval.)]|nr:hypothetical protein PybrP1_009996 [[Pythium] brassicae (nom. inval.)]
MKRGPPPSGDHHSSALALDVDVNATANGVATPDGVTNGSRHSTRSDACDSTRSWGGGHADAHGPTCRARGRPRGADALPSSHYYVDADGRVRVRRLWWLYTRLRRLLAALFPWCQQNDSNTFLCAAMISNSALIVSVFLLRLVINRFLLGIFADADDSDSDHSDSRRSDSGRPSRCHEFSQEFLEIFSYSLIGNVLLCLPAFNLRACKLFRKRPAKSAAAHHNNKSLSLAHGADDDDEPQYEKTALLSVLELVVIFEIPYLVVTFVLLVFPTSDNGLAALTAHCYADLPAGYFCAFAVAQAIGLAAYALRWNQIRIFQRLHEHLLFQRGCLPGRARFDYVESSFRAPLWASRAAKQRHALQKALYRAAKRGDVDAVRALVREAAALDGADFAAQWYGDSSSRHRSLLFATCRRNPLHVAVVFDQAEVVEELLAAGHLDVHELEKMELLKLDVSWLYRFLVGLLVSVLQRAHFAHATARRAFGPVGLGQATLLSPLHVAVSMGNADMALLLLRYGADPNRPARSSRRQYATPPLFWAANKECARLLLDADANPLHVPGRGVFLTPFEAARLAGNVAVARQLEKFGGDVALTPLHDAASRGRTRAVRLYLEHGADPNSLGEKVTGYFRRTPLHWAAMRGETGAMKLLLRYGAAVDAPDVFGRTPLMWACVLHRAKAAALLLANGADCNLRDVQGDPILCLCAAGACTTMSTATPSSSAGSSRSPRGRRRSGSHDHAHHDDQQTPHTSLARSLEPEIFELLRRYGVDVHATRQCNGDSALHVALRKNNASAAVLFVRAGVSLTAPNYWGQRAIDCATSSALRYAVKKEAGHRDVMISYCHAHAALARRLRDALEQAHVTTWIDAMDPSGITGGAVWRQEIARGIQGSALVLAVLTADYPASQWCMKELAFAKMQNVPVVAIQCEDMAITEELQVYLWTRQIVDFRAAVTPAGADAQRRRQQQQQAPQADSGGGSSHVGPGGAGTGGDSDPDSASGEPMDAADSERVSDGGHEVDEDKFRACMRLLLDGIQDQIEEHRLRVEQRPQHRRKLLTRSKAIVNDDDDDFHDDFHGDESESEDELTRRREDGKQPPQRSRDAELELVAPRPPSSPLSVSVSSAAAVGSYVFIANGDFHKSFCRRLQRTLEKSGVRSVVDQAMPAVQYARRGRRIAVTGGGDENEDEDADGVAAASVSVQARQLAAKDAILGCAAVLVVVSPLSAKCDVLADQLAFAEDRGKLVVPVLLSLHAIDLAKRYTFSRSVLHHFNTSVGFEQSADALVSFLRAQAEGVARQQRRRRRARRDEAADDSASDGGGALFSPASLSSATATHGATDRVPSGAAATDVSGELLPPIPISASAPRRPPAGGASTSGHGWSAPPVGSPSATGGGGGGSGDDDARLFQQQHLHHHHHEGDSSGADRASGRRLSRLLSNASTRTTEYLG